MMLFAGLLDPAKDKINVDCCPGALSFFDDLAIVLNEHEDLSKLRLKGLGRLHGQGSCDTLFHLRAYAQPFGQAGNRVINIVFRVFAQRIHISH